MSNNQPEIHIGQMIVHQIDQIKYDRPLLSDLQSPLSPEVRSFLRQHINNNRIHRYTRSAVFENASDGQTSFKDVCVELLTISDQFVHKSQYIANHLFSVMQRNRNISPGDLVICTFSEDTDNDPSSSWLALLKLDPTDGFIGERKTDPDGGTYIELQRVPEILPTGELQKCAFIVPPDLREQTGYDLQVLDQQAVKYGRNRLVASFFIKNFLQCRVNLNQSDQTKYFIYGSHQWVNKKLTSWEPEDIDRFKDRITTSVQDNIVDLTDFAEEVVNKPEEQEEYLDYMRGQGLTDLTFEPDTSERKRLTQYLKFEGDNGLQVRIRADAVGPDQMLVYDYDEVTNQWIITIRSSRWDRRPGR
jgi:hypothetical protein